MSWDMDGFGTGNAKNSTNTATSSIMQRGVVHFHLENLNPFLPTVDIGGNVSTSLSLSRQGSSAVGSQMDYDLLTRNFGPNTGRAGWGYVFNWDDRSLSGIGIPGRIGRYQFAMASINEGRRQPEQLHRPQGFQSIYFRLSVFRVEEQVAAGFHVRVWRLVL